MVKIEDLKVGDILVGNITLREYKIVCISENNNIFLEYIDDTGRAVPSLIRRRDNLNDYKLKPRQTKAYVVIWKYDNKINVDKIYNESYLHDIKNNCDVLDVLEYYEDI